MQIRGGVCHPRVAACQSGLFRCVAPGSRRAPGGGDHADGLHYFGAQSQVTHFQDGDFRLALPDGALCIRQSVDHATPPAAPRTGSLYASQLNETESNAWMQIEPVLDTAMAQLGEKDHNAVVLRFFEGRDFKDIS